MEAMVRLLREDPGFRNAAIGQMVHFTAQLAVVHTDEIRTETLQPQRGRLG